MVSDIAVTVKRK